MEGTVAKKLSGKKEVQIQERLWFGSAFERNCFGKLENKSWLGGFLGGGKEKRTNLKKESTVRGADNTLLLPLSLNQRNSFILGLTKTPLLLRVKTEEKRERKTYDAKDAIEKNETSLLATPVTIGATGLTLAVTAIAYREGRM